MLEEGRLMLKAGSWTPEWKRLVGDPGKSGRKLVRLSRWERPGDAVEGLSLEKWGPSSPEESA